VGFHSVKKGRSERSTGHPTCYQHQAASGFDFAEASNSPLELENDLFRLETQVSTTLQRNSGPAGTPCYCSGSSVRSCYGSLTGNSRPRCSIRLNRLRKRSKEMSQRRFAQMGFRTFGLEVGSFEATGTQPTKSFETMSRTSSIIIEQSH